MDTAIEISFSPKILDGSRDRIFVFFIFFTYVCHRGIDDKYIVNSTYTLVLSSLTQGQGGS